MNLQYTGSIDSYFVQIMGLILFVGILKFIKLLRFNNRFATLIMTLRTAWDDLLGFFAIFFLVFFAFVQVSKTKQKVYLYVVLHVETLASILAFLHDSPL